MSILAISFVKGPGGVDTPALFRSFELSHGHKIRKGQTSQPHLLLLDISSWKTSATMSHHVDFCAILPSHK